MCVDRRIKTEIAILYLHVYMSEYKRQKRVVCVYSHRAHLIIYNNSTYAEYTDVVCVCVCIITESASLTIIFLSRYARKICMHGMDDVCISATTCIEKGIKLRFDCVRLRKLDGEARNHQYIVSHLYIKCSYNTYKRIHTTKQSTS